MSVSLKAERPEHQLLLACARTTISDADRSKLIQLGQTNIDWDYLFLIAQRHSVLPLLYHRVSNDIATLVPESFLARLKQNYRENAARNSLLAAELRRLLTMLRENGIESVPYKGPVLAVFAYEDLSLRRFIDLDIMVRKRDVLRARDLLLKDGYSLSHELSENQQDLLLRTQHNLQFRRAGGQLIVELHWEVASHLFASSVQAEDIWKNLIKVRFDGFECESFSAEDLLFSLCVHGSRHLWERLAWICDLAELLRRHAIDWPRLLQRSENAGCDRMFLLGLVLAERLFETQLPETVKRRCRSDEKLELLADRVIVNLLSGVEHVPASSGAVFRYNLQVRRKLSSRARYLAHALRPTDSDVGARALPDGVSFAYYFLRPFRLLFKAKPSSKDNSTP